MKWTELSSRVPAWVPLGEAPTPLREPIDPYLVWAAVTGFAGFAGVGDADGQMLPLAIQLKEGGDISRVLASKTIVSPPIYGDSTDRCFTAFVPRPDIADLARHPDVRRVELGLPLESAPVSRLVRDSLAAKPGELPGEDECVVGIVDFGCPFLNRAFCQGGTEDSTRLVSVWQQQQEPTVGWKSPARFGYGREIGADAIDSILRSLPTDPGSRPAAEVAAYQVLGYLYDPQGRALQDPHGGFVLDTAAGRFDPQFGPASAKPPGPDDAENARLVFVDVPRPADNDTSGAPLCAQIIDAMHYIVDRAGAARKIVINLSIGAQAGPHDGSSIVEEAIDELVQRLRGEGKTLAVVISAGNTAEVNCHAEGKIPPGVDGKAAVADFMWRVMPDDDTDSYLEIWYDGANLDDVTVELVPPFGASSGAIGVGQARVLSDGQTACATVLHCRKPALGEGTMALLAVAPSKASARRRVLAPHGLWRIVIRNASPDKSVSFYAWVERDDTPVDIPAGQRQSVLSDIGEKRFVDGRRGTLNNLGTGNEAIVVAASDLATRAISKYSGQAAAGARRRRQRGAQLVATADESPTALGLMAAGNRSGDRQRMSGTSVAAPVAARALVNFLARSSGLPPKNRQALIDALLAPVGGHAMAVSQQARPVSPATRLDIRLVNGRKK